MAGMSKRDWQYIAPRLPVPTQYCQTISTSMNILIALVHFTSAAPPAQSPGIAIRPLPEILSKNFPNSHASCRWYLNQFVELNPARCKEPQPRSAASLSIHSGYASYCTGNEKELCDGKFKCIVKKAFSGCSKDFLEQHLNGEYMIKCWKGKVPRLMNNEGETSAKANIKCMTKEEFAEADHQLQVRIENEKRVQSRAKQIQSQLGEQANGVGTSEEGSQRDMVIGWINIDGSDFRLMGSGK